MPGTQLVLSLMARIIYNLILYGNHAEPCKLNGKRLLTKRAIVHVKSDGFWGSVFCELSFRGDFLAAGSGVDSICSCQSPTTT